MKNLLFPILFAFNILIIQAQIPSEEFDKTKMEYKGSKSMQAKMLMRHVDIWGKINEKEAKLDVTYLELLNSSIGITKEQLQKHLHSKNITNNEIGGDINSPISHIIVGNKKVFAKYFVIHDVSSPVYKTDFPTNINDESWSFNNVNKWSKKVTHVYLTRTGKSKTVADFSEGLRATKFELKILGVPSRGLYVHIELVQPRVYPPGNIKNAPVAPKPGFTNAQYEKLALLYICSSFRKGEWLVPAFHANIDQNLNDSHDDPQNFETQKFTDNVLKILLEIKKT
ncbi:hypothetical protein [Flavobacterium lipolyticum]|uniref:GLPGLI family protein n=1 Tax=Flavobacterium lipolyticum TaxID=2893754 RepID=A0ABS8M4Q5_9FLAO|nr:hypothetical protein [Flavobacterium sp. F-126]MCC9019767.1 hypothetical protein [Flavobacterium sp. F-126]